MKRFILLLVTMSATMAKLRTCAVSAMSMFAGATLALAVLGLMVLGGDRALAASQLSCGETITTDTTLHTDLLNCSNNGIVIGADGITLDLNGHLIDGDGTQAAGCDPDTEFCDVGVLNKGHDGVTIRGGSVRQFNDGVWAGFAPSLGVSHNRLLGISSSGNDYFDILLIRTTRSLIRKCSGSDSGIGAMFLDKSHHVQVLHNSFRHSGYGIAAEPTLGVFDSTDNLIAHNSFSGNKNSAIDMRGADRNRMIHNSSVRDGNGIVISEHSDRNVIARNHIAHASEEHPHHGDGIGIEHNSGDHNIIEDNLVLGTTADAILVGGDEGVGNVVRRNHILGAGRNGIHVASIFRRGPTSSNVVYRNYILGAGDSSGQPEDAHQITPWEMGCENGPEFSPKGEWVLFRCQGEGGSHLYWVHPNGTGLEQLTNAPFGPDQPDDVEEYMGSSFSPEFKGWGDIVAARYPAYGDEGNSDVFRMHIDDGVQETVNLTKSNTLDDAPSWGTYLPSARQ